MQRCTFVLGTIPLYPGLVGCSDLIADSPMLSVTVFNQSESPYTVEMTFSRTEKDVARSEGQVFSGRIDVEADGQSVREDVAEQRQYLMENSLYENNSSLTDQDHVHYHPGDEDESGSLAFDIDSSGTLTRR